MRELNGLNWDLGGSRLQNHKLAGSRVVIENIFTLPEFFESAYIPEVLHG